MKKISDKVNELFFEILDKFEMKTMKDYHDLYLTLIRLGF